MGLYDRDYSSNKANRGFQRNENYIYEEERVERVHCMMIRQEIKNLIKKGNLNQTFLGGQR